MRKMKLLALCLSLGSTGLMMSPLAKADGIGPDQNITIKTDPAIASHCIITNSAGSTAVQTTPRKVNVMKSAGVTTIRCLSNDGMWHGLMKTKAKADGWNTFISIPWTIFRGAGDVADGFQTRGGAETTIADSVKYPDVVTVKLTTEMQEIQDAQPGTEEEAIANQPYPDVEPEQVLPSHQAHHKVKKTHRTYHVAPSKS